MAKKKDDKPRSPKKDRVIPVPRDKQKYKQADKSKKSPPDTDQSGDSDIQDTGPKKKP